MMLPLARRSNGTDATYETYVTRVSIAPAYA
jgi:hypothetical protein